MVTAEELVARREAIPRSADLSALRTHLRERAAPLLARLPPIPAAKALYSRDGGVCPDDGTALAFDPWSPGEHRCPRCGKVVTGERHDRHWARSQHLWLAERAAHLATVAALDDDRKAAGRSAEILRAYAARYWQFPNRDNVLGPSRLFFSTYLESVWIGHYLSAALLLRTAGMLDDDTTRGVTQVADEAANLIGEFDEGFSNRQTWNNAGLAAIATWFEDEELAKRAIEGPTGLLEHLLRGFGRDGMWYEGENYHLFALRGLLMGSLWARHAGVDVFGAPQLGTRVQAALLAPARTALPDFTYPARKDSRFGVSLAQPAYVELWEVGRALLGAQGTGSGTVELDSWLGALYGKAVMKPELFDSYLSDAPLEPLPAPLSPSRRRLSWWALWFMAPELPTEVPAWAPGSLLLESHGLAVLRTGRADRYVSLECGQYGGGHGHPDRLHLTLHADGTHWLADPGTGPYADRDLFWHRSTLAHNAPRLDGVSQAPTDATCDAFDTSGEWSWARGRFGEVTRTVVSGPVYVLDVVELASRTDHTLEVPWHFSGSGDVGRGTWASGDLADEFVTRAERFTPDGAGPASVALTFSEGGYALNAFVTGEGELLRAEGPGRPGSGRRMFYMLRGSGRAARFVTVLEPVGSSPPPSVRGVRVKGSVIEVDTNGGIHRHAAGAAGWEVETEAGRVRLTGARAAQPAPAPFVELDTPKPAIAVALRTDRPPPLDGSLEGFDRSEPLRLELEDQYRRSEEPYSGPEDLSAVAYAAWDDEALYLAVEVTKQDLCFRAADAPPLHLDNEPDDIHSDGLQVYLGNPEDGEGVGYLIVPVAKDNGSIRARVAGESAGRPDDVHGGWHRTPQGYRVTVAIRWPEWHRAHVGGQVRFDLLVNEMEPGRERRSGQLVWSGGNGWVYLRGDRQDRERFGVLELVG